MGSLEDCGARAPPVTGAVSLPQPSSGLRRLPAEEAGLQRGASVYLSVSVSGKREATLGRLDGVLVGRGQISLLQGEASASAQGSTERPLVCGDWGYMMACPAALAGPRTQPAVSVLGKGGGVDEESVIRLG